MRLDDARRLTGPNLYSPRPVVLLELFLDAGETAETVRQRVQQSLAPLRAEAGLAEVTLRVVSAQPNWVALAHDAPLEEMLLSAELLELAVSPSPDRSVLTPFLPGARSLSALEAEAHRRGVPFLWDDALVSLGHAKRSQTFPRDALPAIDEVNWSSLGAVPIAMVTGTNGKTTSTRLLARMAQEAGFAVGITSSDSVTIAGRTLHEGDWTGPAAAREVLRNTEVELAVLETARGGILRRGLACDAIDVALLTNISDDHLGGYGVNTLEDMAKVKAVVASVARKVVLNARDPHLRKISAPEHLWFADLESTAAPFPLEHAVVAREGTVFWLHDGLETPLVRIDEIPLTFRGAARHNVENALGATAAALALGLPPDAIARALKTFTSADNPGRGETFTRDGVTIFVDFAHNADGVASALHVARALLGRDGRLTVITGSAGDRTDAELTETCARIRHAAPAVVFVRELEHYLRGRQPNEVPAFFERELGAVRAASEVDALDRALKTARTDDVIALLVHVDRDEVRTFLDGNGWHRTN